MSEIRSNVLLSLFLSSIAWTCNAQQNPASVDPPTTAQEQSVPADPERPALHQRHPRYQIQPQDTVLLAFPLSPEFNQTLIVQPDGYITLMSAGELFVQGMNLPELTTALKKAYSKTLRDPIINVDLKDFQKPFFVVSGQVAKPGQFELRYDTTVSQAIAVAGGQTQSGTSQVFLFHRVSPGWMQVKKLDLKDMQKGKSLIEDAQVQPGDMLYVPEKFITKFKQYVPYSFGMYYNPVGAL